MEELVIGDTLLVFLGTILVMLMTPGLALFYGGMVRSKNVLSTTMHSYSAMIIVSLQWILVGYSIAFGPDHFGLFGDLSWFGLESVGFGPNADYAATIPQNLFMMFQMMFAILTTAIISGAYAERMKFSAYALFTLMWVTFVYSPVAHWVWGAGGWLRELGALDFAGGNVVHITSGVSGLIIAILLGKRANIRNSSPNNLPLAIFGAGILWFGWFGFNVASALSVSEIAMNAFVTTNTAAAAGAIGWSLIELMISKKPTVLGAVSGAVAGLVSITPGCGFVTPLASIAIGFIGGIICYYGVTKLKNRFGYDDTLDAFGLHGVGGTWGGIATGLFATTGVNSAGANGLFYGGVELLGKQTIAIVATWIFAATLTYLIMKFVDLTVGIRVKPDQEMIGLDLSIHGEKAYERATL